MTYRKPSDNVCSLTFDFTVQHNTGLNNQLKVLMQFAPP